MTSLGIPAYGMPGERPTPVSGLLFACAFLLAWISLNPFSDLAREQSGSPALAQLAILALGGLIFAYAAKARLLALVLQPRPLIALVFFWFAFTALGAPEIGTALRRLFVVGLVALLASLVLVLPRDRGHFSRLLGLCVMAVLALCYFGVIALPGRSIHQATDLYEMALAGDWRGVFIHKNIAAPIMVVFVFCGLYIAHGWSKLMGWLLVALALVFLVQTNGKTALGLLPLTLVMVWLLERRPRLGGALVMTLLAAFGVITVGAAFIPAIGAFVEGLGIDATFTARADVWNLAIQAALERPLAGYGFQSFWQTDALLASDWSRQTWAVTAAHAHNGYLEAILNGGVPALFLVLLWLVFRPLGDVTTAVGRGAEPHLTRLYARIWLFALLLACLESTFFTSTDPMWFSLLIAVFGLNYQARAHLVEDTGKR